jgi:EmrB/QacA subfamily drug resistance transporter
MDSPTHLSPGRAQLVALIVAGTSFMENLDGTVIATALPNMARDFHVEATDLNIGMSAYMLTVAVLIPLSGWVADRLGSRSVFAAATALFTIASVLCGLCDSVASFTAARVLQGVGGAMMMPVGRLVVLRSTERRDLMRAIATITWPALAAPVLGPPIGGLITTTIGWRWIFYLNVPLGIIALGLIFGFVANHRGADRRPFDAIGFLLCGAAIISTMSGLEMVAGPHANGLWAGLLMAGGGALAWLWVYHARHHRHPLVQMGSLRFRTFAVTLLGGSFFRISIGTVPFLLPLLFQVGFGMDALTSGLLVFSVFAGNLAMKILTSPILRRFGFRHVLVVNGVLSALTTAACAGFAPDTPQLVIMAVLFLGGLSRSMEFSAINTLAFVDVPQAETSGANAFFTMMQQLSLGLGIAFGAIGLRVVASLHGAAVPGVLDFRLVFLLTAVLPVLAVIDFARLAPDAGALVSGRGKK